ncbi:MAG: T9SS type A sorting domain-containing protein [Cytophagales bacterium]|nr:T9SS type A sorting domain-containing protein [Cytophagales bacterium]
MHKICQFLFLGLAIGGSGHVSNSQVKVNTNGESYDRDNRIARMLTPNVQFQNPTPARPPVWRTGQRPMAGGSGISLQKKLLDYIKATYPEESYGEFELKNMITSPAGFHYLFQQTYMGFPVYEASTKINLAKVPPVGGAEYITLRITSVFDNTFLLDSLAVIPEDADTNIAGKYLQEHFKDVLIENTHGISLKDGMSYSSNIQFTSVEILYADGNYLKKGILLRYGSLNTSTGSFEILFDKGGMIIHEKDLNTYAHGVQRSVLPSNPGRYVQDTTEKDSLVNACIFNPDPLTTANVTYGSPYVDSNDVDIVELNAERDSVMMTVKFKNDTFFLESPYCVVGEYDPPANSVCFDTTADLCYTRSDVCFEQVNIFYHINNYQDYLQSLGFDSLVNYQIKVDANGMSGADNSMFSSFSNLLSFGEGGVDDGEDADVIIHEYGHAISYSAAPNTNTGTQRKTLDEANADYLAASLSRSIDTSGWQKVFNWDGHNGFWSGRWVISNKHYPEDWVGGINQDADIWSATLMQIWEDIGRTDADRILLQSLYSYAPNLTFTQAAYLFLQADSLLYNGANYFVIYRRFRDRGILPLLPYSAVLIDKVDPVCYDSCDGQAAVIVLGGVPPYTYQWDDSTAQDSSTAIGLCAGTYVVTFVDSLGDTASVTIALNEPTAFSVSLFSTPDSCTGCSNGTAAAIVSGGSGNFIYQWNDPDSQATATATGLTAGIYIVTITDTFCGNTSVDTVTVGSLIAVSKLTDNSANNVEVFPNPSTGIVTVQVGRSENLREIHSIKLYNIMGEYVARIGNPSGKGADGRWSMDISDFTNGIYFMKIQTVEKVVTKKIVLVK